MEEGRIPLSALLENPEAIAALPMSLKLALAASLHDQRGRCPAEGDSALALQTRPKAPIHAQTVAKGAAFLASRAGALAGAAKDLNRIHNQANVTA